MTRILSLICTGAALVMICFALPVQAQNDRGKAELKAGSGVIIIDFGRPALKGRDMLAKLPVGEFWRMGSNDVTLLKTPVALSFGAVKIPKGACSLWLKCVAANQYELFFNSQDSGHGMSHDASKDIASVPLKKETVPSSVEVLTIELKEAPGGGTFSLIWGNTKLSADFQTGK